MALRLSSSGYLSRTTGALNYAAAYSWMGWVQVVTDENDYGHFFSIHGVNGVTEPYDHCGLNADGLNLRVEVADASNFYPTDSLTQVPLVLGTWAHVALVRTSATQILLYKDAVLAYTLNHASVAGRAASSRHNVGNVYDAIPVARFAWLKEYTTNLSQAEIAQEMRVGVPVRHANLNAWHPLFGLATENLRDYSGQGRNYTVNNTVAYEDGPPVTYGAPVLIYPYVSGGGGSPPDEFLQSINATAVAIASLSFKVTYRQLIAATALGTASLSKKSTYRRLIGVVSTAVPTISKRASFKRAISVVSTALVAVGAPTKFLVAISAVSTAVASVATRMKYRQLIAVAALGTVSFAKRLSFKRTISVVSNAIVSLTFPGKEEDPSEGGFLRKLTKLVDLLRVRR